MAVKMPMVVMRTLRDKEAGPQLSTVVSPGDPKTRHSESILITLAFNWDMQDRYVELVNFEMEDLNILETIAYKLSKEKVPKIKKWLG